MVSLINSSKALLKVAENLRSGRLAKGLTQEGLANRSGVSLSTLRKFERTGQISLESFFKLAMALGLLGPLMEATKLPEGQFSSIDEVLEDDSAKKPKQRGWRK